MWVELDLDLNSRTRFFTYLKNKSRNYIQSFVKKTKSWTETKGSF